MNSQNISSIDRTVELLRRNELHLESQQVEALSAYVALLLEWNAKVNLISRKDQENVWGGHILHSLSILFHLKLPAGLSVLDLGSGGGLPGIPLAIARPDVHFTLLDSIRKKTTALDDIIAHLPVGNVRVINARAEELLKTVPPPNPFHIILSRAVAPLADLVKWTRGLYAKDKRFSVPFEGVTGEGAVRTPFLAAFKGGELQDEIRAARLRHPSLRLIDIPLNFEGSAAAGLEGKRVLIAPM